MEGKSAKGLECSPVVNRSGLCCVVLCCVITVIDKPNSAVDFLMKLIVCWYCVMAGSVCVAVLSPGRHQ